MSERYQSRGAAVVEERVSIYGSPVENMERIAQAFSAVLGVPVTPVQASMLFVVLKVVRESQGEHLDDNLDDIEGYVEIARRVVSARKAA